MWNDMKQPNKMSQAACEYEIKTIVADCTIVSKISGVLGIFGTT